MEITIADLASVVGKDENYVRQHIRREHLVARREGRRVLVEESEAARWAKERGLPFRQPIATLGLDDEIGERAARVTVLALRTPDGTAINLFTLVRHRDRNSLGPWVHAEDPNWQREIIDVENSEQVENLVLYRLDATLPECQEIVQNILRGGSLAIADEDIRYALEPHPRRHWAYQEHTMSDAELLESPFDGHSAEMTEYWCFDSGNARTVAGDAKGCRTRPPPRWRRLLHFPIARRLGS